MLVKLPKNRKKANLKERKFYSTTVPLNSLESPKSALCL
jgi:hypothetical protein